MIGSKSAGPLLWLLLFTCPAIAIDFGSAAAYSSANESLSVNGRQVRLKTGGIGLRASQSFLTSVWLPIFLGYTDTRGLRALLFPVLMSADLPSCPHTGLG